MPPPPPPPPKQEKALTVLLTGFGSFARIADNPSWSIVESLLSSAPLVITTPSTTYTLRLLPYPSPIKVCYATIDTLVPSLWESGGWDYVLHIGVGHEGGFQLERRAWEEGYVLKDVDGRYPGDGEVVSKGEEMKGVHGGEQAVPPDERPGRQLYTALDIEAIATFVGESIAVRPPPLLPADAC